MQLHVSRDTRSASLTPGVPGGRGDHGSRSGSRRTNRKYSTSAVASRLLDGGTVRGIGDRHDRAGQPPRPCSRCSAGGQARRRHRRRRPPGRGCRAAASSSVRSGHVSRTAAMSGRQPGGRAAGQPAMLEELLRPRARAAARRPTAPASPSGPRSAPWSATARSRAAAPAAGGAPAAARRVRSPAGSGWRNAPVRQGPRPRRPGPRSEWPTRWTAASAVLRRDQLRDLGQVVAHARMEVVPGRPAGSGTGPPGRRPPRVDPRAARSGSSGVKSSLLPVNPGTEQHRSGRP